MFNKGHSHDSLDGSNVHGLHFASPEDGWRVRVGFDAGACGVQRVQLLFLAIKAV
jgi:hypothetical protein